MSRRTLIFAAIGLVVLASVAFILSPKLIDGWVACGGFVGADDFGCPPNRTKLLGIRLSDREVVGWTTVLGALWGAIVGLIASRVLPRRTSDDLSAP